MKSKLSHLEVIVRYLNFLDPMGGIYDSIESGAIPDEYDSYAPRLFEYLKKGINKEQMFKILKNIQSEDMACPQLFDEFKTRMVSTGLVEYFDRHK